MLEKSKIALCAGKRSIADYLVKHQGFSILYIDPPPSSPPPPATQSVESGDELRSEDQGSGSGSSTVESRRNEKSISPLDRTSFATVEELLAFVTKRWECRWVTIDIRDDQMLERLSQRPWFLLVSVDAPVMVRWERFQERQVSINYFLHFWS